ncbi:MAG: hypothetical protein NTV29_14925 [Planctomycetota bacterium]|nr:hypothetical protein [Planctomycetota bacterium]
MEQIKERVRRTEDVVLRNYVPKDTPANAYRMSQVYHHLLVAIFFFWAVLRIMAVVGTQVYRVSETAVAMMPLEVRSGALGAFLGVCFAGFNIATCYGLLTKETWGWWLALVGLTWTVLAGIANATTDTLIGQSWMITSLHVLVSLALCALSIWLLFLLVSPMMRKKFGVMLGARAALGIGVAVGSVLGLFFFVIVSKT